LWWWLMNTFLCLFSELIVSKSSSSPFFATLS
jgi:hypothetical protein